MLVAFFSPSAWCVFAMHSMMTVKCKWRLTEKLASIFMTFLRLSDCISAFAYHTCVALNIIFKKVSTWCKLQPVFHPLTFDDIWVGFLTQFSRLCRHSLLLFCREWLSALRHNVSIIMLKRWRRQRRDTQLSDRESRVEARKKKIYWFLKMCLRTGQ